MLKGEESGSVTQSFFLYFRVVAFIVFTVFVEAFQLLDKNCIQSSYMSHIP